MLAGAATSLELQAAAPINDVDMTSARVRERIIANSSGLDWRVSARFAALRQ
jgi:hypothetical protein